MHLGVDDNSILFEVDSASSRRVWKGWKWKLLGLELPDFVVRVARSAVLSVGFPPFFTRLDGD